MAEVLSRTVNEHFKALEDPRRETLNKRHKFIDILVIAIAGTICGANDWVAIEGFGKAKEAWFRRFLELPHGIPSHDTFNDVFAKIDPEQFHHCFISWAASIAEILPGEVIPVDGKTLRRSHDRAASKQAIHVVSAWATSNSLVLGQLKTEEKSNEITAIPQLLEALAIQGCLVTIDAMGCQKKIAETIVDQDADYLLALKDNQPTLHQAVENYFDQANENAFKDDGIDYDETIDKNHGRTEVRRCWVSYDLDFIPHKDDWKKLNAVVMIESQRTVNGETAIEHRYYLSSSQDDATALLEATRKHWQIESAPQAHRRRVQDELTNCA